MAIRLLQRTERQLRAHIQRENVSVALIRDFTDIPITDNVQKTLVDANSHYEVMGGKSEEKIYKNMCFAVVILGQACLHVLVYFLHQ